MKNDKKLIEIINEFPTILYNIKTQLMKKSTDHILDASSYSRPISLLAVANPDLLLLNLDLPGTTAIEIVGTSMQENMAIKLGMITSNPRAYYMSLCSTFSADYLIENGLNLEMVPEAISRQQLN